MKKIITIVSVILIATLCVSAAQPEDSLSMAKETVNITQSDSTVDAYVKEQRKNDSLESVPMRAEEIDGSFKPDVPVVYSFPIREDIMPSAARLTNKCLEEALEMDVDYVVIDLNTYGGLVDVADSIRTKILNYPKPIYVFINNQAASAGALIAIAADRIYMRSGASMGAATVVGQDGMPVPDKYQSFMRGMMRSTAEAHGKVVDKIVKGDTLWRWYRDPQIAEAMVDPSIVVPGLIEEGKVLTFSTEEAIEWHYCEGKVSSIADFLKKPALWIMS